MAPILAGGAYRQRAAGGGGQAMPRAAQHETGGQAFDIPFERAWQGFIEIIDVEQRAPFGRGEAAEIGQMRVTAELHGECRVRQAGQVLRHHCGGATVEGEGADAHAGGALRQ